MPAVRPLVTILMTILALLIELFFARDEAAAYRRLTRWPEARALSSRSTSSALPLPSETRMAML